MERNVSEPPGAGIMENVMFLEPPGAENVLFLEPPGAGQMENVMFLVAPGAGIMENVFELPAPKNSNTIKRTGGHRVPWYSPSQNRFSAMLTA
jgi:hypothetical protein